jgi:hypothetical protein
MFTTSALCVLFIHFVQKVLEFVEITSLHYSRKQLTICQQCKCLVSMQSNTFVKLSDKKQQRRLTLILMTVKCACVCVCVGGEGENESSFSFCILLLLYFPHNYGSINTPGHHGNIDKINTARCSLSLHMVTCSWRESAWINVISTEALNAV